jgi:hypothetical protein
MFNEPLPGQVIEGDHRHLHVQLSAAASSSSPLSSAAGPLALSDGISLILLIFVVLCIVVYYWFLWSFAWWLEGHYLRTIS